MTDDGEESSNPSMSPDSMDEERPLKKAKYVWQIKGRYRLGHHKGRSCSHSTHQPDEHNHSSGTPTSNVTIPAPDLVSSAPVPPDLVTSHLDVVNSLPVAMKPPVDAVNLLPDAINPPPDDFNRPPDAVNQPLYVVNLPLDVQCRITRWQTQQMARAVVDNTINKVLEDIGFTSPPENLEEAFNGDFPTAHNREGIEDQAVLMAIQSHGLQKASCNCSRTLKNSSPSQLIPFHHRPSTIFPSDPICAPSTSERPSEKYAGETDFLAQAVAVAIQKKGLGSHSQTDHC